MNVSEKENLRLTVQKAVDDPQMVDNLQTHLKDGKLATA